jgi:hypothetical protein
MRPPILKSLETMRKYHQRRICMPGIVSYIHQHTTAFSAGNVVVFFFYHSCWFIDNSSWLIVLVCTATIISQI